VKFCTQIGLSVGYATPLLIMISRIVLSSDKFRDMPINEQAYIITNRVAQLLGKKFR
jgi:hypothetical protein